MKCDKCLKETDLHKVILKDGLKVNLCEECLLFMIDINNVKEHVENEV